MQLKDYIKGNRRGKEANKLEREAMNDPFLQEALDGFDSVAGNHVEIIKQLEEKYTSLTFASKPKKRIFFYWAAAASVLLLIGFIGFVAYFLPVRNIQTSPVLAEVKSDIIQTPEIQSDMAEMAIPENITTGSSGSKADPKDTHTFTASGHELSDDVLTESSAINLSKEREIQTAPEQKVQMDKEQETQKKVADELARNTVKKTFGENEFRIWCRKNADKSVCAGKSVSMKVSFFIDEVGKPDFIEYLKYSCEDAKKEMGRLLSSSPLWTKTNRKVTITVYW